jgi:predicted RNA methylase
VSVQDYLEQIWQLCHDNGVADDFTIVIQLGHLLLPQQPQKRLAYAPKRVALLDDRVCNRIRSLLRKAMEEINGQLTQSEDDRNGSDLSEAAARLFNDYLLEYVPADLDGARYTTQRGIATVMGAAVFVTSNDTVGDLTCGAGRLLVTGRPAAVFGVEVAGPWLELAALNVALHGMETADLIQGDMLKREIAPGRITALLMDPPRFGPSKRAVADEEKFVTLALRSLARQGRAAILVSSELIRTPKTDFEELCRSLLAEGRLAAVIGLPPQLARQKSTRTPYLLIIGPQGRYQHTWFISRLFETREAIHSTAGPLSAVDLVRVLDEYVGYLEREEAGRVPDTYPLVWWLAAQVADLRSRILTNTEYKSPLYQVVQSSYARISSQARMWSQAAQELYWHLP